MTTPDPITTAREALDSLLAEAERGRSSDGYIETVNEWKGHYERVASEGDAARAEITRLTSQLEQAERVIAPFVRFAEIYLMEVDSPPGSSSFTKDGVFTAISTHQGVYASLEVADLRNVSQWIKDRQAKGEG